MCCLFGVLDYSGNKNDELNELVNSLAQHATIRGMDSTGIAYNKDGVLKIYKKPLNAYEMVFSGVEYSKCITGHTRHATQGSETKNYNNHPFMGFCENAKFALSHNGVLWNDTRLRTKYGIVKNKIETDSYIAVQLLEHYGTLNFANIAKMAEEVSGSFAFSMVDTADNLWLVKGDSPLTIVHLPKQKMYVYASTDSILFGALNETEYVHDIVAKDFDLVPIKGGDILCIDPCGNVQRDTFDYYVATYTYDWRIYGTANKNNTPALSTYSSTTDNWYLADIKAVASGMGITEKEIDDLIAEGFSLGEIEDWLYDEKYYNHSYSYSG
jgi:glucosamine 6-phosphate synthetase-like amidotransferase/phosphosugar isomerase protein